MNSIQIQEIAKKIRYEIIKMAFKGQASHVGSSLSCVDLIVSLYNSFLNIDPKDPQNSNRDRFILSKGHAVSTLYAILAYKDFFSKNLLETFNLDGSTMPEHPTPRCVPGLEAATGSLGHGLSLGIGHALAAKILKQNYKVVVLLSDGECNEGSVWEAAMFAPAKKLNNLICIVDYNKWQATAKSNEVLQLDPLADKWRSFGWKTHEIDGHDIKQILDTLNSLDPSSPNAIIAHTIKGKGISFMENDNNWHYRIPNEQELLKSKIELGINA